MGQLQPRAKRGGTGKDKKKKNGFVLETGTGSERSTRTLRKETWGRTPARNGMGEKSEVGSTKRWEMSVLRGTDYTLNAREKRGSRRQGPQPGNEGQKKDHKHLGKEKGCSPLQQG